MILSLISRVGESHCLCSHSGVKRLCFVIETGEVIREEEEEEEEEEEAKGS